MLGCEVNKPSKILINTSNVAEYIESDLQNIEARGRERNKRKERICTRLTWAS